MTGTAMLVDTRYLGMAMSPQRRGRLGHGQDAAGGDAPAAWRVHRRGGVWQWRGHARAGPLYWGTNRIIGVDINRYLLGVE
jgi:hypothetical protein